MHPTQVGPYRVVKLLGAGGMGAVYEAIQEPIERRVALKVLLPQFAQHEEALNRFFNEARVVNLIEHPSIVQISDYGQTAEGAAFLVMECLRGESLSQRLKRLHGAGERLPTIAALQIAAQLADALTAAHQAEVIHRDLKPANIMLVRDPVSPGGERAKVLDFGIAKLSQGQGTETATNAVMGTPQYMSPEQCRGAGGVDNRTDVYALGVILYEMLAGRTPFIGPAAIDYMAQHSFDEPPPLRNFAPLLTPDLVALVHQLLVKDKTVRPPMQAVANRLLNLAARGSGATAVTVLPPQEYMEAVAAARSGATLIPAPGASSTLGGSLGQTIPPIKRLTRRRLVALGGALGLIIALTVLGMGWRSSPPPTAPARPAPPPRPLLASPLPSASPPPVSLSPPPPALPPPPPTPGADSSVGKPADPPVKPTPAATPKRAAATPKRAAATPTRRVASSKSPAAHPPRKTPAAPNKRRIAVED